MHTTVRAHDVADLTHFQGIGRLLEWLLHLPLRDVVTSCFKDAKGYTYRPE